MPFSERVLTEELLLAHLNTEVFPCSDTDSGDRVGIEMELFPLVSAGLCTGAAQPTREAGDLGPGLYPWLHGLADRHGWVRDGVDPASALAYSLDGGGRITLEPGGQIEYSTPPFASAADALEDAERIERLLCREGESAGLAFAAEGFNRWLGDDQPALVVEKPRYSIMDRHLEAQGPYGRMMMRRTCATQICLDFGRTGTMARRWRAANLIAGPLNALFANAPHTYRGETHRSFRHEIWRHTDPCRAGILHRLLDHDPVGSYLGFALDASVMLIATEDGVRAPAGEFTFRDWLTGNVASEGYPDLDDWRLHLTTLFPDVRPKGFLEIRSVDALPARLRRAAVTLASVLLYNDTLLDRAIELCSGGDSIPFAIGGSFDGLGAAKRPADYLWTPRFGLGRRLLELAIAETGDPVLLEYHREFTEKGLTPADRLEPVSPVLQ